MNNFESSLILQFIKCYQITKISTSMYDRMNTSSQKQSPQVPCKNFASFAKIRPCWSLFLIKLQAWRSATLLIRESNKGISCELSENFKNIYFEEHLRKTVPECPWKISSLSVLGKPMLDGRWHSWATNAIYCKYEPHEDS